MECGRRRRNATPSLPQVYVLFITFRYYKHVEYIRRHSPEIDVENDAAGICDVVLTGNANDTKILHIRIITIHVQSEDII